MEITVANTPKDDGNDAGPIRDVVSTARGNSILAALAPQNDIIVLEREIEVADVPQLFYIKQLSHAECSSLDAKKYRRGANQQLVKDVEHEETVAIAWQIHTCVMEDENAGEMDASGEALAPKWKRMFTLEQVLGGGKTIGLMTNPNRTAQELIYSLTAAIWEVNPALNPIAAATAAAQMGLT